MKKRENKVFSLFFYYISPQIVSLGQGTQARNTSRTKSSRARIQPIKMQKAIKREQNKRTHSPIPKNF